LRLVQPEKMAESKRRRTKRKKNAEVRSREYLTPAEVKKLRDAARSTGRHPLRDDLLIGMAYRHGLRASEIANLTRDQIHFDRGTMLVTRVKRGTPATHYMTGEEIRQLRRLFREYPESRFVFTTERKGPMSIRTIHDVVARAGVVARLPFTVHCHMLRHARGYKLANDGTDTRSIQAYLGHRDIKSTVVYTQLSAERLKGLESDD